MHRLGTCPDSIGKMILHIPCLALGVTILPDNREGVRIIVSKTQRRVPTTILRCLSSPMDRLLKGNPSGDFKLKVDGERKARDDKWPFMRRHATDRP